MKHTDETSLVPSLAIEKRIYTIRGHKVMFDSDLAELYGIETRTLNQSVKRNLERFPDDFMFRLTLEEVETMPSQIVTASKRNARFYPYVFTEQGVAMLSSVLRSPRAIQVNVAIMRAFVSMREILLTNRELGQKIDELEKKYDKQFKVVFEALRKLMSEPVKENRQIGYRSKNIDKK